MCLSISLLISIFCIILDFFIAMEISLKGGNSNEKSNKNTSFNISHNACN